MDKRRPLRETPRSPVRAEHGAPRGTLYWSGIASISRGAGALFLAWRVEAEAYRMRPIITIRGGKASE